jgi:HEAT repeats
MRMDWNIAEKSLGAALIAVGLLCGVTQQLRGGTGLKQGSRQGTITVIAEDIPGMPNLVIAKVESREVRGSLRDEVNHWSKSASKAKWLAYSVPAIQGDRLVCCENGRGWDHGKDCGTCRLEGKESGNNITTTNEADGRVKLEGPKGLVVLYRADSGKITRIRIASEQCTIDAGGLEVLWLMGVNLAESVGTLEQFVHGVDLDSKEGERIGEAALAAIALHEGATAEKALESFTAHEGRESLRKEAAFWLGEARGAEGLQALQRMAKSEPSSEVREQVTFALSVSKEPGALAEMIRMAREDKSAEVRGQALFWLAQQAGQKAEGAIAGAIENDPDTEVKKKAVFALSQMPQEEGVPKLIQVAESNRNPVVRKEAIFWLGQSEDPRALKFFEKVLGQ